MKSGLQSVSWEIEFLETELRSCVKSISQGTIVQDLWENQNTKKEKDRNRRKSKHKKNYSEKDGNRRKSKLKNEIPKRTEIGEKQNAPPLICLGLTNQPIKLCKPPWPQLG